MRLALGLSYSGTAYHGWQFQPEQHTLQQQVESALSKVADQTIEVYCAGRTDRGVHATEQVIHFDTDVNRPLQAWIQGTNTHLPDDIAISWAHSVSDDFHARFSATARRYWYVIYNRATRPGILMDYITWHYPSLDEHLMQEAAQPFLGEQDFSSFRSSECQSNTPMRNVFYLSVKRSHELIIIDICANAFLHHMVRNIVGVLIPIGQGKKPTTWAEEVLKQKDRKQAGITAPPQGLFLVGVDYPKAFKLPKNKSIGPWFLQQI